MLFHKKHPQHLFVLYLLTFASFFISLIVFIQSINIKNSLQQIVHVNTQKTINELNKKKASNIDTLQTDLNTVNTKINAFAEELGNLKLSKQ